MLQNGKTRQIPDLSAKRKLWTGRNYAVIALAIAGRKPYLLNVGIFLENT